MDGTRAAADCRRDGAERGGRGPPSRPRAPGGCATDRACCASARCATSTSRRPSAPRRPAPRRDGDGHRSSPRRRGAPDVCRRTRPRCESTCALSTSLRTEHAREECLHCQAYVRRSVVAPPARCSDSCRQARQGGGAMGRRRHTRIGASVAVLRTTALWARSKRLRHSTCGERGCPQTLRATVQRAEPAGPAVATPNPCSGWLEMRHPAVWASGAATRRRERGDAWRSKRSACLATRGAGSLRKGLRHSDAEARPCRVGCCA